MRRLTQKELANEGIGSFLKNVGKGAAVVAGKALKGVAKAASPTAYGLAQQAGKAFKDTDQAVQAATMTPEERIENYFKDQSYIVKSINPGVADDTKVVKVSEIVYNDDGSAKEVPTPSPFVVKVKKQGIETVRGPRTRNPASKVPKNKDNSKPEPEPTQSTQSQPAAQSQPATQTQPAAAAAQPAAPAKPAAKPAAQARPAAQAQPAKPATQPAAPAKPAAKPRKLDAFDQEQLAKKQAKREPRKLDAFDQEQLAKKQAKREELAAQTGVQPAAAAAQPAAPAKPAAKPKPKKPTSNKTSNQMAGEEQMKKNKAAAKKEAKSTKSRPERSTVNAALADIKKPGFQQDKVAKNKIKDYFNTTGMTDKINSNPKYNPSVSGVRMPNRQAKKILEKKISQKSLLKHLHSSSRMNKWLVGR